jgi:hypothetical protein
MEKELCCHKGKVCHNIKDTQTRWYKKRKGFELTRLEEKEGDGGR